MASGIDWFRWHHGTALDAKFSLVAKKAGTIHAVVVALWAVLLEAASQNGENRGHPGNPDFESIDLALGIEDGLSQRLYALMKDRNLIDANGRLSAWEKRQPKREREDNTAPERKRRQREREEAAATGGTDGVTPRHAKSHQETPREEESREEGKENSYSSNASRPTAAPTGLNERKAQRLAQVTADAAQAYNAILARPNGLLASVNLTVGKANRERWVGRCLTIAAEICQEQFGSKHISPEFWAAYFTSCKADPFKSGQQQPGRGHDNWTPTFEYLTRPKTMLEVFDKAVSEDMAS